jgi:hypothetical protein
MRARIALTLLVLALVASGCSGAHKSATGKVTEELGPATRLVDLEHPSHNPDLFSLFNAGQGVPRLVLLISPT